jgi:hypothetical protein
LGSFGGGVAVESAQKTKTLVALLVAFELAYVFMVVMIAVISKQPATLAALSALVANVALFAKEPNKPATN